MPKNAKAQPATPAKPNNSRMVIALAVVAILVIVLVLLAVAYHLLTSSQSSALDNFRAECITQCHGAQAAGTQPFTFCFDWTSINNVTYNCTSIGLSCNVSGYVYDKNYCPS